MCGQSYSVSLVLTLPDTVDNQELGMFMSCVNVSSVAGVAVERVCRSAMMEHRSGLLRTLETLAFSPGLLLGFSAQRQDIKIDFLSEYVTDPHCSGEVVAVEVQSKRLQQTPQQLTRGLELSHVLFIGFQACG